MSARKEPRTHQPTQPSESALGEGNLAEENIGKVVEVCSFIWEFK